MRSGPWDDVRFDDYRQNHAHRRCKHPAPVPRDPHASHLSGIARKSRRRESILAHSRTHTRTCTRPPRPPTPQFTHTSIRARGRTRTRTRIRTRARAHARAHTRSGHLLATPAPAHLLKHEAVAIPTQRLVRLSVAKIREVRVRHRVHMLLRGCRLRRSPRSPGGHRKPEFFSAQNARAVDAHCLISGGRQVI